MAHLRDDGNMQGEWQEELEFLLWVDEQRE
jgi:hypothetical protein